MNAKQPPAPFHVTHDRMGRPGYVDHETVIPPSTADLYVALKQFKPGELAAEYHWAMGRVIQDLAVGYPQPAADRYRRAMIARSLYRFATLPHAADSSYE